MNQCLCHSVLFKGFAGVNRTKQKLERKGDTCFTKDGGVHVGPTEGKARCPGCEISLDF